MQAGAAYAACLEAAPVGTRFRKTTPAKLSGTAMAASDSVILKATRPPRYSRSRSDQADPGFRSSPTNISPLWFDGLPSKTTGSVG